MSSSNESVSVACIMPPTCSAGARAIDHVSRWAEVMGHHMQGPPTSKRVDPPPHWEQWLQRADQARDRTGVAERRNVDRMRARSAGDDEADAFRLG